MKSLTLNKILDLFIFGLLIVMGLTVIYSVFIPNSRFLLFFDESYLDLLALIDTGGNGKLNLLPVNVKVPKEIDKPYICHLRCGYGYVWNKMDINWIKMDGNFIRWMSDWNEILYALNNYGQPFKINTSLIVYNLESNKTKNENNNYKNMINFF